MEGASYEDLVKAVGPAKPSYVKSAAATVVRRPLAQHTPELTSMVPFSFKSNCVFKIQRSVVAVRSAEVR